MLGGVSTYTLRLSEVELGRYRMMAEAARLAEADLWTGAGIRPGARVADVGCGPGAALAVMAREVGPDGHVSGVDGDPEAVSHAQAAVDAQGLDNADVRVGAADATGLEPGTFDVAVMRHVLAHNGGAEQRIVEHLAALVRPGGAVYLVDVDLTALRIRPTGPVLEELAATYVEFHRRLGNDPQVGVTLAELITAAGLDVETYRGWYTIMEAPPGVRPPSWAARDAMVENGVATAADVARWGAVLDELDTAVPRPRIFAPTFVAVGRRRA
jgi:SAM-dependent methyltransferase